jgi:hypothetical protein
MKRIAIASLLLALALGCTALEADPNIDSWAIYEQGNAAFARRDFGIALKLYQEAIAAAGIFPEAEMAIGDVYLEEGEPELSIIQYDKAYNLRKSFYIPDMQYDVLYKKAHVYENLELYSKFVDMLNLILVDDNHFQETANIQLRTQIEKNYFDKGIDRVLFLYSFPDAFSANAHSKLGWFYYRSGRYGQAVSHLLFSVIYRVSQIKAYLKERDVTYQFTSLKDLLGTGESNKDVRQFISDSGLYTDLYYLAGSTFASGYPQNASSIWQTISAYPGAGSYQDLAKRQVKKPWLEPLLSTKE